MIASLETAPAAPPAPSPAAPRGRTKAELLATVSASRLGTWLGCRLKFYFRYVLGIRKPTTPARHVGTVVHAVLQQWNLARWRRAPLAGEMIAEVFEQAWTNNPEDEKIRWDEDDPEAAVKAGALGLVEMYLRDTPIPPDEKPEAVEVSVERDLAALGLPRLVGVPNAEMARHGNDVQLTAYALLYRAATDRRESALELHHLVKTKTPKLVVVESGPATEVQTARFFRLAESYVRGVETDDYVPAPGFMCASCEFFNECRRWH